MPTCACGNPTDQEGALCARCAALQVLGLTHDAHQTDIESAYRMLVKVWHPDRFQSDPKLRGAAEEKLKSINAASAFLASDAGKVRRAAKPSASQPTAPKAARKTAVPSPYRAPGRGFFEALLAPAIVLRCVLLFCSLLILAVLLFGLDAWLSSDPTIARFYTPYRSRLLFALRSNVSQTKQQMGQTIHRLTPPSAAPASAAAPATVGAPTEAAPAPPTVAPPHVPMPYVTVGLTKDEVMSVMGAPSSSTSDAIVYRNAVFYLRNGVVSGWKVAPSLIPLHVKLWPQGHVDPRLAAFTVGSSKNDVIAVQGTPSLLSESKFGYGGSEVFFEEGRVVGWNDNHASERLHVAASPAGVH